MTDISTRYMGLELRSPVIAGSSTHTIGVESVKALADQGVGAVVLKSLFEEQIRAEVSDMYDSLQQTTHPEAYEYLRADLPMRIGPDKYLQRLKAIKAAVDIPVFASINCARADKWVSFARQLQECGADGLEINIYDIADNPDVAGSELEDKHVEIVKAIQSEVSIPVAVKISPYYSSVLHMSKRFEKLGVNALVFFNRFFQPDIDIETLDLKAEMNLSRPEDIRLPLRWIALVRGQLSCDLALTSGVHDMSGLVRALLAGANAVQVCSVLYEKGAGVVGDMLRDLSAWMARKEFSELSDFMGRLRQQDVRANQGFERAQYMKTFVGLE